jgi:hypothetical protein
MKSGAQLALGRVTGRNGLEHFDIGRAGEVLADRAEQDADGRRGAVGLERIGVGPLFDEHEGVARLVQRVQLTARFVVDRFDGREAG